MNVRTIAVRLVKFIFFKTSLYRYFLPVMKFDMSICQLNFIIQSLLEIKGAGNVLEIGVGGGSTSIIINQIIKQAALNRKYIAIDTFSGFTDEDISYEHNYRGKSNKFQAYQSNSKEWFEKTLIAHDIHDAVIIKSDCKEVNYEKIGPIAFCLFDVDLYLPTKEVLPVVYQCLIPGGVIIVDDCDPLHPFYDGAGQAYREFCKDMGVQPMISYQKLGIIKKPIN